MNQKIRDTKYRIRRILTDYNIDNSAVLLCNNAVKSKRKSNPLILLDSAIVVCIKKSKILILIKRILLNINTRRVNVRTKDMHTLFHRLSTNYK